MLYRKNVGTLESWARVAAGVCLAIGSIVWIGVTPLGLVLSASGAVMTLTGLFGYCPACAMVGRKAPEGPQ